MDESKLIPGCWYQAARFSSRSQARSIFDPLQQALDAFARTTSVYTLLLGGSWHVIVLAMQTQAPSLEMQRTIQLFLGKGSPVSLGDGVIRALVQRRDEKLHPMQALEGHPSVSHEPVLLRYEPDAEPGKTLMEEDDDTAAVVADLRRKGYPFLEIYKVALSRSVKHVLKTIPTLQETVADILTKIYPQCLSHADTYLLTETARAMQRAVLQDTPAWIPLARPLWIEQDEPLATRFGAMKAAFVYPVYPVQEITHLAAAHPWLGDQIHQFFAPMRGQWRLDIILETTGVPASFCYDEAQGWIFASDHVCWSGQCKFVSLPRTEERFPGFYEPCALCLAARETWARWLHTTLLMIQKRYAVAPQEPLFPTYTMDYQVREWVPRVRGKGKPKEKLVTHQLHYTLITYEVSVLTPPVSAESDRQEEEEQELTTPVRSNWITLAGKDDLIWEQKVIPDHQRRYPRTKNGRRPGLVEVHYAHQKWVPMLKPEKKKHATMKKVTARRYAQLPEMGSGVQADEQKGEYDGTI